MDTFIMTGEGWKVSTKTGQAQETIEGPAMAFVMYFEPASLVDRLIDDVALLPAPLPLLSFALSELYRRYWARRGGDRVLRAVDYNEMGSVLRALTQRATAVYDGLVAADPRSAITVRNIMLRAVATVNGERVRRRVRRTEVVYADADENARVDAAIEHLAAARLLVSGVEYGEPYVEPAHDELVRGWDKVGEWLDAAGTATALMIELERASTTWRAHGRARGYLWHVDPRLSHAAQVERTTGLLNAREHEFIEASHRRRRDSWLRLGISAVAMVLALAGLTLYALLGWGHAETAQASERARYAKTLEEQGRLDLLAGYPTRAAASLGEAYRLGANRSSTRYLLAQAMRVVDANLTTIPCIDSSMRAPETYALDDMSWQFLQAVWRGKRNAVRGTTVLAASADGRRLLCGQNELRIWEQGKGIVGTIPGNHLARRGTARSADLSRDGRWVLTFGDGPTRLWRGADGQLERTLGPSGAAAFLDKGTQLVVTQERELYIWDIASHARIHTWTAARPISLLIGVDDAVGGRAAVMTDDGSFALINLSAGLVIGDAPRAYDPNKVATRDYDSQKVDRGLLAYAAGRVSANEDGQVRTWDLAAGRGAAAAVAPATREQAAGNDRCIAEDPLRAIRTRCDRATVRLYSIREGTELAIGAVDNPTSADKVVIAGGRLFVSEGSGVVRVYELDTLVPRVTVVREQEIAHAQFCGPDRLVIRSADGSRTIVSAKDGHTLFPVGDGTIELRGFTCAGDGSRIVATAADDRALVWSGTTGAFLGALHDVAKPKKPENPENPHELAASADGHRLLAFNTAHQRVLWDLDKREIVRVFGSKEGWNADFSTDGSVIVGTFRGVATLWSTATGARIVSLDLRALFAKAGPGGELIASRDLAGACRLTDTRTGRSFVVARHLEMGTGPRISPDGSVVAASTTLSSEVAIWDAHSGVELAAAPGRVGGSTASGAFTADGARMLVERALTASIIDTHTGAELAALPGCDQLYGCAQFSPDGDRLMLQPTLHSVELWAASEERRTPVEITALLVARLPFEVREGAVKPRRTSAEVVEIPVVADDPHMLAELGVALGDADGAPYLRDAIQRLEQRLTSSSRSSSISDHASQRAK